jgi:hypothetical protein
LVGCRHSLTVRMRVGVCVRVCVCVCVCVQGGYFALHGNAALIIIPYCTQRHRITDRCLPIHHRLTSFSPPPPPSSPHCGSVRLPHYRYIFPCGPWVVNGCERGSSTNKSYALRDAQSGPDKLVADKVGSLFLLTSHPWRGMVERIHQQRNVNYLLFCECEDLLCSLHVCGC